MKKYFTFSFAAALMLLVSCSKDNCDQANLSDSELSKMASSENLVMMRTVKSSGGEWRIKMNSLALLAHKDGNQFPVNSMIVKQQVNSSGEVISNQTMFRTTGDPNSDNGWLYSESNTDGHIIVGTESKGASCKGCHVQATLHGLK